MTGPSRVQRALLGLLLAVALVATGAVATVALRSKVGSGPAPAMRAPEPAGPSASGPSTPDPAADVEVVLSADALMRIGLKTASAAVVEGQATIQVPGTVMPNAYREVKVTPVAGGIVTKTDVELGSVVRRGAPLLTSSVLSSRRRRRSISLCP